METVIGRFIFKSFKTLSCELVVKCKEKSYYPLVVELSKNIANHNYYAAREIVKGIRQRIFCESKVDYDVIETIGKLEQKLKNKLDRVYIG